MKPVTIEHTTLEPGITAEAVSESKIVISKDVPKDSELYKRAIAHEGHHAKEMRPTKKYPKGKIEYGPSFVRDGDQVFARQNGKIQQGSVWKMEVSKDFPWERRAFKAEEDA
jgi:hypothetical protein